MQQFRVRFKFDHENVTTLMLDADDKQGLYSSIISHKEWFYHEDDKGVLHVVNMDKVTEITIAEYQPATVVKW